MHTYKGYVNESPSISNKTATYTPTCDAQRRITEAHVSLSSFLSFLSPLPPENGQSSESVWNRCPDTRFSLMRIRNILIKTHNPPLNPSLQNHLHSVVLPHTAAVMAHPGPLFCFSSSLTQGCVSLCLPSVSVIFDPLSLDFPTR